MDPITIAAGGVTVFLGAVVGLFKLVFTEMRVQRQEAAAQLKDQREAFESTMNNHISKTAAAIEHNTAALEDLANVIREVVHGPAPK